MVQPGTEQQLDMQQEQLGRMVADGELGMGLAEGRGMDGAAAATDQTPTEVVAACTQADVGSLLESRMRLQQPRATAGQAFWDVLAAARVCMRTQCFIIIIIIIMLPIKP
jgi:hypothetical protein